MDILGESQADLGRMTAWAIRNGASPQFVELAEIYCRFAPPRGVRADVAYAQAAKETGFGQFGGVIDETYRNPCGMKKESGGGNYDPEAHQRFPTWEQGVIAHIDHLAIYAGALGYPRQDSPDPRHFDWIYGDAPTVEDLGGKWAPSETYGESIVRNVEAM